MITLVTGHVGSGKSYHLLGEIRAALDKGREVYTNLSINIAMFEEKYPGKVHQFRDPIKMPDGDGLDHSWGEFEGLCASPGKVREALIVIDEAGTWWRPRYMFTEGERVFFQRHRHNGLDIILATPDGEALAACLRRIVNYHVEIENLAVSAQRILGVLPPPPVRVKRQRLGYRGPVQVARPFNLDLKQAVWYSTTGGTYGYEPDEDSRSESDRTAKMIRQRAFTFFFTLSAVLAGGVFLFSYGVRTLLGSIFSPAAAPPAVVEVVEDLPPLPVRPMGVYQPRRGPVVGMTVEGYPIERHGRDGKLVEVIRLPDGTVKDWDVSELLKERPVVTVASWASRPSSVSSSGEPQAVGSPLRFGDRSRSGSPPR